MARQANPRNELSRRATERWRAGLRTAAAPEACHVDTALAAAVSVCLARVQESGEELPPFIKTLIADALKILESRGYEPTAAKRKTMARLLYRRDRAKLQKSVEKTVTMTNDSVWGSPHYSPVQKRRSTVSRSDAGGEA